MTDDQRETPTKVTINVGRAYDEGVNDARYTLCVLAEANRCSAVYLPNAWEQDGLGSSETIPVAIYGFAADVAYVEMMWTSIALAFASTVHPRWDEELPEGENIRRLKSAGFSWEEIARRGGFDWPDGGKVKRVYLRHLRAIGAEDERVTTQRHGAYRTAFIVAFYERLNARIAEISKAHEKEVKTYEQETGTTGSELVLADRSLAVREALYADFPMLRPATDEQKAAAAAARAERIAREQAEWEALSDNEKAKRWRVEQKERRRNEKAWDEYMRRTTDSAGSNAGRNAADKVNLSRATGVSGVIRKEIG